MVLAWKRKWDQKVLPPAKDLENLCLQQVYSVHKNIQKQHGPSWGKGGFKTWALHGFAWLCKKYGLTQDNHKIVFILCLGFDATVCKIPVRRLPLERDQPTKGLSVVPKRFQDKEGIDFWQGQTFRECLFLWGPELPMSGLSMPHAHYTIVSMRRALHGEQFWWHPPWKEEATDVKPGYKTQLCKHFLRGICTRGQDCTFAHGAGELQAGFGTQITWTKSCRLSGWGVLQQVFQENDLQILGGRPLQSRRRLHLCSWTGGADI